MVPSLEPTRMIKAHVLKGNLSQFEAEWLAKPLTAATTLVTFELCADPHFPFPFGSGTVSDHNEKQARRSIAGLRRYMADHGLAH